MAVFPLLADPARYRACETDLLVDHDARQYWLNLYVSHLEVQLSAAAAVGVSSQSIDAARREFLGEIKRIEEQPNRHGRLDILLLAQLRQTILQSHAIRDEFRLVKQRENEAALAHLGNRLKQIDEHHAAARLPFIVRGMLAGNLFDMGVPETAERFANAAESFATALDRVPDRPWLIDDLDEANREWLNRLPRKALIFADNAGADAVLGLLPLARDMLKRGVQVVIAANDSPCLNDVTNEELKTLIKRASEIDRIFESSNLRCVASGNHWPLIDLMNVSDALAGAASNVDLIVLIGMGRGVESNFSAQLTCESWSIAMIKDPQVARTVHGNVYDAVFVRKQAVVS